MIRSNFFAIIVMHTYMLKKLKQSQTQQPQVHPKMVLIKKYHDTDVVIPMYNLMEYSNIYSKISGSLWQYYRDQIALDANDAITDAILMTLIIVIIIIIIIVFHSNLNKNNRENRKKMHK